MTAIRIIDDHIQLASIGSKTHVQIEGHIQGIGNYAFPAADGGADQVLKTNGAGVLTWIDKNHSIASHNDTSATGAQLDTLVDNSIADALHRHSELVASDGSPDPVLSCDAAGNVSIGTINLGEKLAIEYSENYRMRLNVIGTDKRVLFEVRNTTDTVNIQQGVYGAGFAGSVFGISLADSAWMTGFGTVIVYGNKRGGAGATEVAFVTNEAEAMRIDNVRHIGIGTSTPATSALLDLTSTTGAILLTRMTTTQRNALTAVNGMLIYNSTLNKFQGYENGAWTSLI